MHSTSHAARRRARASLALVAAVCLTIANVPSAGLGVTDAAAAASVTPTAVAGSRAPGRAPGIGGIVFVDCNENGIQDLKAEFDEHPDGGYKVTLERVGGGDEREPTSNRKGEFYFADPTPGSYVVTFRVTSTRYRATTPTRHSVVVGSTGLVAGAYADFGLYDTKNDSGCPKAASAATSTPKPAASGGYDQRLPGSTTSRATSSGSASTSSSGSSTAQSSASSTMVGPAATATAASVAATATVAAYDRMVAAMAATATAIAPTATPLPTTRLSASSPKTARFHLQAVVDANGPNRLDMLAEGAFVSADAGLSGNRTGADLLSMRIQRNDLIDDIVLTGGKAYRQSHADPAWREVPFDDVRTELGYLIPLDMVTALRCVGWATEEGPIQVDGHPTTLFTGEVDARRLWDPGSSRVQPGAGASACTAPPTAGAQASHTAAYVYQSAQLQAWVGLGDGKVRAEHLVGRILPPITDPKTVPTSMDFQAVLRFSDVDLPITIQAPVIPVPTPVPPPPAPAPPAPITSRTAPAAPAPPSPATPTAVPAIPTAVVSAEPVAPSAEPEAAATAEPEAATATAEPATSQQEQVLAAERALARLALGGEPRTGSTARGSEIVLDVPWRSQLTDSAYTPTNSGPAALAAALGAYGIDVTVGDLRALTNGLDSNYNPHTEPRIETIARVAERGGLNALDLFRGPRFREWSVEQVREKLKLGYPVATIVQGTALPGGTPAGVARERYIVIVGLDGDDVLYNDPAYADAGAGALRRMSSRTLEQAWLAATTPRQAMALAQGPEARGLLAGAQLPPEPTRQSQAPSPSTMESAPVPVVPMVTIEPLVQAAPSAAPEDSWALPVHPALVSFWTGLVLLLLALLIRCIRWGALIAWQPRGPRRTRKVPRRRAPVPAGQSL